MQNFAILASFLYGNLKGTKGGKSCIPEVVAVILNYRGTCVNFVPPSVLKTVMDPPGGLNQMDGVCENQVMFKVEKAWFGIPCTKQAVC